MKNFMYLVASVAWVAILWASSSYLGKIPMLAIAVIAQYFLFIIQHNLLKEKVDNLEYDVSKLTERVR